MPTEVSQQGFAFVPEKGASEEDHWLEVIGMPRRGQ
jgi:hypothetical protein